MNIENVQEIYSLSPLQEAILLENKYNQEPAWSCGQICSELFGDLDINILEKAWQTVVDNYSILRTFFVWKRTEKSLQVVQKKLSVSIQQFDWRNLSEADCHNALNTLLEESCIETSKASTAPLVHLNLCRTAENVYQLFATYHYLVLDSVSIQSILKSVLITYEKLCKDENWQIEIGLAYRDYIKWLKHQNMSAAQTFWQRSLEGITAPTPVGVERSLNRSSLPSHTDTEQWRQITTATTEKLKSLVSQAQIDLDTIIQGAWALLLNRYTNESDIVFGISISSCPPEFVESQSIVGPFINTLPIRINKFPNHIPVVSWLKELHTQYTHLSQYSYCSSVQIHEWSCIPSDLPLFESTVVWQNCLTHNTLLRQFGNISVRNLQTFPLSKNSITLSAHLDSELILRVAYDNERFDSYTITNILDHLQTLLENIAIHPEKSLGELSLLTASELHQLLVEWNNTKIAFPNDHCIHQLFETQVVQNPKAIAVRFQGQQITYQQLNSRANQLAHHLQVMGVVPDVLVGICVDRSIEMLVGIFGILKAGGAYVPLDPSYPFERLSLIINEIQPPVLLTQEHLLEELPSLWGQVICLDSDWDDIAQESEENLVSEVTSRNLSYIIYTSGSTGTPKGVMVEHRGVCNLAIAQQKLFHVGLNSRVLQYASLSFDASVWEIIMALTAGATLVLASQEDLLPGPGLLELLQSEKVTIVTIPPSILAMLPPTELPELQTIIVAGEACLPDLVARWAANRYFFNAYGPTESTVCATVAECTPGEKISSIGSPIANTHCYLLDAQLRPVPIGVPGELCIGGVGLARGYLNRPDLTTEKFIPHPFSIEPDAKLYKTGDLARYLPNGQIEFLRRIDNQVKLRGLRIELGEIEAGLIQHPAIQHSVVVLHADQTGNQRIVSYVVPHAGRTLTVSELRSFLKEKFPDYMIPNTFVFLETLPLTPNGKINRRALPEPEQSSQVGQFVAPRDRLELDLALIWSEVLNVYPVGIKDDFFELGGHSLLTISLMAQIQEKLGKNLPLATLFQGSTVEKQAAILRQEKDLRPWCPIVAIQPKGTKSPLFCVHPGGGRVLAYLKLAQYLGEERPVYGLEASGFQIGQKAHSQVAEMAKCYVQAIQIIQPEGPYLLAGWCLGGMIALEMAQQLYKQGQTTSFLGLMDIYEISAIPTTVPDDTEILLGFLGENLSISPEEFRQMSVQEQLSFVMEQAQQFDMLPPDVGLEEGRCFLNVARSHTLATSEYLPQPYEGKVTLFQACEGLTAGSDNLMQNWQTLVKDIELNWIPGNHRTMLRDPNVKVLADKLRDCLARS